MTPRFPIISIFNNALEIIQNESQLTSATVLGVLKGNNNSLAYDINGDKWTYELISDNVKNNFLTRLLANTFYNPSIKVYPKWFKIEKYKLHELKIEINKCVDRDDDILTQYIESDRLKQAINNSSSFDEVFQNLNMYVFNVDEQELYKKK